MHDRGYVLLWDCVGAVVASWPYISGTIYPYRYLLLIIILFTQKCYNINPKNGKASRVPSRRMLEKRPCNGTSDAHLLCLIEAMAKRDTGTPLVLQNLSQASDII